MKSCACNTPPPSPAPCPTRRPGTFWATARCWACRPWPGSTRWWPLAAMCCSRGCASAGTSWPLAARADRPTTAASRGAARWRCATWPRACCAARPAAFSPRAWPRPAPTSAWAWRGWCSPPPCWAASAWAAGAGPGPQRGGGSGGGGGSVGGGRGWVTKALVGTLLVLLITNGLTSLSAPGGVTRMVLATILVLAAVIDVRWLKNRQRIIGKVYVSPTYPALPPAPPCPAEGAGSYALNDKLRDVTPIGLGRIEAPEDVILDRDDNLYAGSRHGDVIRFFAPDYERMEVYAHIGGQPLGLAFDRQDNLHVCVGGMGLYR